MFLFMINMLKGMYFYSNEDDIISDSSYLIQVTETLSYFSLHAPTRPERITHTLLIQLVPSGHRERSNTHSPTASITHTHTDGHVHSNPHKTFRINLQCVPLRPAVYRGCGSDESRYDA